MSGYDSRAMQEALRRGLYRVANAIESRALEEAPVVTGNLQQSIFTDVDTDAMTITLGASSAYALYVHEGTGLYGPHNKRIHIEVKNAVALHWGGYNSPRFYKSVNTKGQEGNPFLRRAIDKTDIPQVFADGFNGRA